MPAGIWSFLQAQLGLQTLGVNSDSKHQEVNGKDTGVFDALVAEYTTSEETGQKEVIDTNPKDNTQVLTLRRGGTSSFNSVKFVADDVEGSEAKPAGTDTWRNLFVDTKRVMDAPIRKTADFSPQNDFDEGVAVVYDEPEVGTLPHANTEDNRPEAENYSETPITEQPDFATPKADVKQPEFQHPFSSQHNMAESVEAEGHPVRQEQPRSELPNNEPESQELPLIESPKNDTPQPAVRDSKPTITESSKADVPNTEPSSQELPLIESPKNDNQQTIARDSRPVTTETPKADTPDFEPKAQELPLTESPKNDTPQPAARDSKPTMTDTPHTDVPNTEPSSQELPLTESPKNDKPQPIARDSKPTITESPKTDVPDVEQEVQELPVDESPEPDILQTVAENSKPVIPESPKSEVNTPQKSDASQPVTQDSKLTITESPKADAPDLELPSQELPVDGSPKLDIPQPIAENSKPVIPQPPKSEGNESQEPDAPQPVTQDSKPVIQESPETDVPATEPELQDLPVDEAPKLDTMRPVAQDSKPEIAETPNVDVPEYLEPETALENSEALQERTVTLQLRAFTDTDDVNSGEIVNDSVPDIETGQVATVRGTVRTNIFADVKPAEESPENVIVNAEKIQPEPANFEAEDITPVIPEREPAMNENPAPKIPQSEETDKTQPAKPEVSPEIPEAVRQEIPVPSEPHDVKIPEHIETETETPEVPAENVKPEITPDIPASEVQPKFEMTDAPEKPIETPNVQDTEAIEIPQSPEHNESNDMPNITKPDTDIVTDTVRPEKSHETPGVNKTDVPEIQPELEMTDAPESAPKPEGIQHDSNNTQVITEPDIDTDTVKPENLRETPHVQGTETPKVPESIKTSSSTDVEEVSEPSENHEPLRTSPREARSLRQRVASTETRKAPEVPASEPETLITRAETPEVPARENTSQALNVLAEAELPEIPAPDRAPQATPEYDANDYGIPAFDKHEDSETHEDMAEIPDADFVMAGLAQVQQGQPAKPEESSRESAVTTSRADRPSRTQPQSSRRTQATAQEVRPEITDDTQPKGTEFSRTSDQPGHEEVAQSGTPQPSQSPSNESRNSDMPSTERVPVSSARTSRSTSRTDTRTETRSDTRRNEALSDFQSFFDSVTRVKRTASRVNTRPLSLRTGTYEITGTQSQGRTLRNGIVNVVRFIRSEGVRKANIVVDPPALGRITVELTSGTSGVEASVKVASEQIRQIIQNQLTQLRDNLLQQGVQVSEFTVDVQQDNSGQGRNSGNENQRSAYSFTASDDDDETENFRADIEEGLLYWIA